MSKHALSYGLLLAVAASLAAAGIGYHVAATPTASAQVVPAAVSPELDEMPHLLPTVHVSAQAPIPVLPTVLVRASALEQAAALAEAPDRSELATLADRRGGGSLPNVHLDMPYYSFGKVLPRISKE